MSWSREIGLGHFHVWMELEVEEFGVTPKLSRSESIVFRFTDVHAGKYQYFFFLPLF